MTEKSIVTLLAFAFVFMLGAVVGNCGGSIARSQAPIEEVTDAVALARLCVNESGMRAYARDDCAAIYATIAFRSEHVYGSTFLEGLHRYSRNATVQRVIINRRGQRIDRGRRWIVDLWPHADRPAHWPNHLRWNGRHSVWWQRTYQHALDLVNGDATHRCESQPHTWARSDVTPADPEAERIDCGNTLNVFWSIPAYRDRS